MQVLLITIFLLLTILLYWYFFAGSSKAHPNSKILGTDAKRNNIFHQLLVDSSISSKFNYDGILLCFEKVKRNRISVYNNIKQSYTIEKQYKTFGIDQNLTSLKNAGLSNRAINLVKCTLNDPKPLILTHWLRTTKDGGIIEYNSYDKILQSTYDLSNEMVNQYELVGALVKERASKYTHIIIGCSGWNNDQKDSMGLYSDWLTETKKVAIKEGKGNDFNPLFIGFTWPSRWIIPGISIFNKANDADELGMTHINMLIWKYLMPNLEGSNIPVITIGHSFGARVLSRAIHSSFMFAQNENRKLIDKAIDFQGAYPYTRYLEKKGSNGGLYTISVPVKMHFITYSKYDYAVKNALWSYGYIGNNKSALKLISDPITKESFDFTALSSSGKMISNKLAKQKILVDGKAIIKTVKSMFSGAHNDVRDYEAGQFIWEVIKR